MKICGHVAEVHNQFDSTPHYFREYLADGPADFTVTVTRQAMDFEQAFSLEDARQEGIRPRHYSDPHLERAAVLRAFTAYLLHRDTILLHGSTVALDGRAYLFTAPCGTGKSTHTRLWCQVLGGQMVNDDKPFLQLTATDVIAHGSPWNGKHGLSGNISVPLAGVCLLSRGSETRLRPLSPEEALPFLQKQLCPPVDPAAEKKARQLLHKLAHRIPLWQMECTPTPEAAVIASEVMGQP